MEPAANVFGLGFSPLETHVVDLWIDARWEGHPGVGHLVELLGSEQFGSRVALVGSYDLSAAGVELENV
jgi:molybdate-binding protein